MDYIGRIRSLDANDLVQLWEQVGSGAKVPDWPPGKAFEHLVLRAFQVEGAEVVWPFQVKREGEVIEEIDGAVYVDGMAFLVESKDYQNAVDVAPIAKMRSKLLRRPAGVMGVVFSCRSSFTDAATLLAGYMMPQAILLWQGGELNVALREGRMLAGLRAKFRWAVEQGFPDYNLMTEGDRR